MVKQVRQGYICDVLSGGETLCVTAEIFTGQPGDKDRKIEATFAYVIPRNGSTITKRDTEKGNERITLTAPRVAGGDPHVLMFPEYMWSLMLKNQQPALPIEIITEEEGGK